MEFIITDAELLPKLATIANKLKNIKHIVYIGEINKTTVLDFPRTIKMISMIDVEDLGARPENGESKESIVYFIHSKCENRGFFTQVGN